MLLFTEFGEFYKFYLGKTLMLNTEYFQNGSGTVIFLWFVNFSEYQLKSSTDKIEMSEFFCQAFLNKTNCFTNTEVCLEHLHCGVNFVALISLEQLLFEFRLFSFKSAAVKTAYTVRLVSKPWLTGWIQDVFLPCVSQVGSRVYYFLHCQTGL